MFCCCWQGPRLLCQLFSVCWRGFVSGGGLCPPHAYPPPCPPAIVPPPQGGSTQGVRPPRAGPQWGRACASPFCPRAEIRFFLGWHGPCLPLLNAPPTSSGLPAPHPRCPLGTEKPKTKPPKRRATPFFVWLFRLFWGLFCPFLAVFRPLLHHYAL